MPDELNGVIYFSCFGANSAALFYCEAPEMFCGLKNFT